jgi:2,3-bisphosphoglycerate-dependent phosphoglycerate mutase
LLRRRYTFIYAETSFNSPRRKYWNQENRFTGWTDVDLSEEGLQQAIRAGQLLKKHGYTFDVGFTSVLKRSIKTMHFVLEELDHLWIPVHKSWRLERALLRRLQGLNKAETIEKYGEEQVHKWRRDPHEHPPAITEQDERFPGHYLRYNDLTYRELPLTENLSETMDRALPFWHESIVPLSAMVKKWSSAPTATACGRSFNILKT